MSKEKGVLKAWEATVRKTQAAKKRANNLFSTTSVAHVQGDKNNDENDSKGSGKLYHVEKVFPNNDYYTGQWSNNFPHGQGKYLWTDGCMYVGEWTRGKITGKGRFSWPFGATYEGEFKNGYMDGTGMYIGSNGNSYKGQWVMNLKHGHGMKNYASGDWYEGEWRREMQEGKGRYQWKNGSYYTGEWKKGEICGKGTFVWANGNIYDGLWEKGLPKGNGTFKWLEGSSYVGNWSKDPSEQNVTYYPSVSSSEANHEWDPHDIYNVDLGDNKICPSEKVLILPSQKKLAFCRSSKFEDSLKPTRTSNDGKVSMGMERPLDRLHMWDGDDGDGDESSDIAGRIPMVENLEDDLLDLHINDVSPRGLPMTVPRRAEKQGETISKGHKNYELMLNLQLGIRHSVGRPTPATSLDLKPSNFDPKEKVWTRFPPEGSKYTPPHQSCEFRWKDYCPLVFRTLRNLFNVDPADYMISICGNDALRELSSPGKSGSFFYLTSDDRYMIKTIKKAEVKVILRMLSAYYNHVRAFENTLVTKFYGLHCVKLIGPIQKKVRFIIMENLFFTEYTIDKRFDLKGSSLGRTTDKPKTEIDETTILKDPDLNFIFQLQKSWFQEFCRHKKIMSPNGDASSGRPLCHCGVPAYLWNSWTSANFGRKWYGCVNYKKPGDCGLFEWADHEMCIYEKSLMERLKDKEEGMRVEIARLEKLMETESTKYKANMESQFSQFQLQLDLYQTKEKAYQSREKLYQAALVFIILLLLFYVCGYNNNSSCEMC